MNLRQEMPQTAAWIDALREAFGKAEMDARIRKGMNGVPGAFYARENGHTVGTPSLPARIEISSADMVLESINPFRKDDRAARR